MIDNQSSGSEFYRLINNDFYVKNYDHQGVFEGYASVFDIVDQHGDRIRRGAFAASIARWQKQDKIPYLLWQHNPNEPLGVWSEIREDLYGLYVRGKLLLSIARAAEVFSLIKAKAVDGLSIGFYAKRTKTCPRTGVRDIWELELVEISLVTMAANPYAKIIHLIDHRRNHRKDHRSSYTKDSKNIASDSNESSAEIIQF